MQAVIVAVGDELLKGMITNSNAAYLSEKLLELGVRTKRHVVVGDDQAEIKDVLTKALCAAEIVITTGGLGPTGDDLTRETVAEALGLELEFDTEAWQSIEEIFRKRKYSPTENNRKQAYIPKGGRAIRNPVGTAPGVMVRTDRNFIILLPGPPREMQAVLSEVWGELSEFAGEVKAVKTVLRVVGIGESTLETKIKDLLYGDNPHAALYAKAGEVHIVITAEAQTKDEAERTARELEEKFRDRLGSHIYATGTETLEAAVAHLLVGAGLSLVTVESCTGGLLACRLTNIPGSSRFLERGLITYSNGAKQDLVGVPADILKEHGAVSRECALAMAWGAVERYGADAAVSITGIAGPTGATGTKPVGLVYIAVCLGERSVVRKYQLHGDRETIKWRASQAALALLREVVLAAKWYLSRGSE